MLGGINFRCNSIGFLRFFFAVVVVWSHCFELGGFGPDPIQRYSHGLATGGILAVGGFFVLSGFLITRSFESADNVGRFLWHRFLRIFPAFWLCLVVVAFGFAPIAFVREHGTISGFFSTGSSVRYVASNAFLLMRDGAINGLPSRVPYPLEFNGSLWTLQYEFLCYLAVAAIGALGILRRNPAMTLVYALVLYIGNAIAVTAATAGLGMPLMASFVGLFFLYFAFGACAYLFRDRLPMRGWIAALCSFALIATLPTNWFACVVPPALAYITLYGAMKFPMRNFDRRMDLSYGVYIYAWPVQQLLVISGGAVSGFMLYFLSTTLTTLAFALASWFIVEKPSLSLKNLALNRRHKVAQRSDS